ncbi:phage holin family protein [Nocardia sp. 2]|uniref:Phage holin family protein n=1 Tax=Nocardia acididurans TaxID=2802282 RepID=A0ABS1MEF9_9NOCA|nr:phage holin family protein [Nocardia acididurans]MBL1078937.1 phage holin family protein [Nocardia acididurans]
MAGYTRSYDGVAEVRPGPVERVVIHLVAKLGAWAGPALRRAGAVVLREAVRAVIVLTLLGFASAAVFFGGFYLLGALVELLDTWMPRWAALGLTSTALFLPAGAAALLGLWQLTKLRTVRAGAGLAARLSVSPRP